MPSETPEIVVVMRFHTASTRSRHSGFSEAAKADSDVHDIAAQAFELLALMRVTAHRGVQAEAVRIGAQGRRVFFVPAGHRSQAQHFLSGARPHRDAIHARGRLQ